MGKIRCFIAIDIHNNHVFKLLDELKNISGLKPVEKENLHITLKFLGEIDQRLVNDIYNEIKGLSNFKAFNIILKGMGAFPNLRNPRVVWIGIGNEAPLISINNYIENILIRYGFKKENFKPHLTVGRIKHSRAKIHVQKIIEKYMNTNFGEVFIDTIKIKKSTLTPKGPIYEDLKMIPLQKL